MKIRFRNDTELELVTDFDEKTEHAETEKQAWKAGEVEECDLLEDRELEVDVQFGDGSCCYGLTKDLFDIVPE